jgi:hypothetical protein
VLGEFGRERGRACRSLNLRAVSAFVDILDASQFCVLLFCASLCRRKANLMGEGWMLMGVMFVAQRANITATVAERCHLVLGTFVCRKKVRPNQKGKLFTVQLGRMRAQFHLGL